LKTNIRTPRATKCTDIVKNKLILWPRDSWTVNPMCIICNLWMMDIHVHVRRMKVNKKRFKSCYAIIHTKKIRIWYDMFIFIMGRFCIWHLNIWFSELRHTRTLSDYIFQTNVDLIFHNPISHLITRASVSTCLIHRPWNAK
jgi:hypothetical protein